MVSLFDWLRVILVTALLIPLVYLSTRLMGRRFAGGMRGRNFEVLEIFSIDQHNKFLLARLVDRLFVMGVSPNGLNVLFEVTDPELIKELREKAGKPESGSDSWLRYLGQPKS